LIKQSLGQADSRLKHPVLLLHLLEGGLQELTIQFDQFLLAQAQAEGLLLITAIHHLSAFTGRCARCRLGAEDHR